MGVGGVVEGEAVGDFEVSPPHPTPSPFCEYVYFLHPNFCLLCHFFVS